MKRQEVYYLINEFPSNNRNPKSKKPQLESSGMNIPDYAIERMAKCLLPIMRTYFESEEGQAVLKAWEEEPDPRHAA